MPSASSRTRLEEVNGLVGATLESMGRGSGTPRVNTVQQGGSPHSATPPTAQSRSARQARASFSCPRYGRTQVTWLPRFSAGASPGRFCGSNRVVCGGALVDRDSHAPQVIGARGLSRCGSRTLDRGREHCGASKQQSHNDKGLNPREAGPGRASDHAPSDHAHRR